MNSKIGKFGYGDHLNKYIDNDDGKNNHYKSNVNNRGHDIIKIEQKHAQQLKDVTENGETMKNGYRFQ